MNITLTEAVELSREHNLTIAQLETELGFNIVSGAANVEVAKATPVNAELLAAVEVLWNDGRKVKATQSGRAKRVLGDQDGIAPYRVIVTKG